MHHTGARWCCGGKGEDEICATWYLEDLPSCSFLTSFAICLPLDNSPPCLPSLSQIFKSLMQLTCWSPFHRLQMHLSLRVAALMSVKTFPKVRTIQVKKILPIICSNFSHFNSGLCSFLSQKDLDALYARLLHSPKAMNDSFQSWLKSLGLAYSWKFTKIVILEEVLG